MKLTSSILRLGILMFTRENSCCKFWGKAGVDGVRVTSPLLSFCLAGVDGGELGIPGSISLALVTETWLAVSWESNNISKFSSPGISCPQA